MDAKKLISQSKDQLEVTVMHQNNGEIDKAIASTERVVKIYELIYLQQLESEDNFWSAFPDGKKFAEKMRKMKRDMQRLQRQGVSNDEIGEKMLEKYEGGKILGINFGSGGSGGGDLSWESTAKQLAEEKKRLEQELQRREEELMKQYKSEDTEENG